MFLFIQNKFLTFVLMLEDKLKRYLEIVIKDLCKRTIVNGMLYGKNELVNRMDITYFNLHQRICLEYVEYLFPFYDDYTTLPCGDNEDYKVFLEYCTKTYGIEGDDVRYVWEEYLGHLSFISYV